MTGNKRTVVIRGRVISGLGKSRTFTQIPWVKNFFLTRIGIDPTLGTLNLKVIDEDLPKLESLKVQEGIKITPQQPGFCSARAFHAVINGRVHGAVLLPDVKDYPPWQLEIVSAKMLREELKLREGDEIRVEILI